MFIVWDEPKRLRNIVVHGLDFADASERFDFTAALMQSSRNRRYKAIGELDGRIVVVVYAALGTEAISLISLRRASRKERQDYEES